MTGVGFEPTNTNTSDLESDPLDRSGNQSCGAMPLFVFFLSLFIFLSLLKDLTGIIFGSFGVWFLRISCSIVALLDNVLLSLHEFFLVFATHNAWSGARFFARGSIILSYLPKPRWIVLNLDFFVVVDSLREVI